MNINIVSGDSVSIPESLIDGLQNLLLKTGYSEYLKDGIFKVPVGQIGEIASKDISIVVSPKIDYLESYDYLKMILWDKYSENGFKPNVGYDSKADLSDFIFREFSLSLSKLVLAGLPKKYKTVRHTSQFIRGSVNVIESYLNDKLNYRPAMDCSYDELSLEYKELVVIKQAYEVLSLMKPEFKNIIISNSLKIVMNKKLSKQEIDLIERQASFHSKQLSFKNTFELAVYILKEIGLGRSGSEYSYNALINSNDIFEKFVSKVLLSAYSENEIYYKSMLSKLKLATSNGNKRVVESDPDIVYDGVRKVIIDCKNKNFDKKYYSNADFYQLYTYCKAYKSKVGVLIYPYHRSHDAVKLLCHFDDVSFFAIPFDVKGENGVNKFKASMDSIFRFVTA
jgi:5-methylcytosine-specific restriction endonuclease McrBC regulatory subunit McrC